MTPTHKETTQCFLCEKDITNSVKVISFFNFKQEKGKALCSACAAKDLESSYDSNRTKGLQKEIDDLKQQLKDVRTTTSFRFLGLKITIERR